MVEESEMQEERQFVFQGQCMVLGDSRVGKTSLVKSLTRKEFDPNQTNTQGIDESLVDQSWKNYNMKELVFGDFRRFVSITGGLDMLFLKQGREATSVVHEFRLAGWSAGLSPDWIVYFLACVFITYISASCKLIDCHYTMTIVFNSIQLVPVMAQPILLTLYSTSNQLHVRSTLAKFNCFFSYRGLLIGSHLPLVICYYWRKSYVRFLNIHVALLTAAVVIAFIGWLLLKGLRSNDFQYLHHFIPGRLIQNKRFLVFLCFCRLLFSIVIGFCFGFVAASFLTSLLNDSPLLIHSLDFVQEVLLYSYCVAFTVLSPFTLFYVSKFQPSPTDRSEDLYGLIVLSAFLAFHHCKLILTSGPYYFVIVFPASICFAFYVELFGLHFMYPKTSICSNKLFECFVAFYHVAIASIDHKMLKSALNETFSSLKLKILDFAGDKEYYAYHHMFLKGHALYLIVLNMAEFAKHDFKEINAGIERLKFWVESVCSHVPPKTPIFLVGTHRESIDKNCTETIDHFLRNNFWDFYCDELIENDTEGLVFFPVENSNGHNDHGIQCLQKKIVDVAINCKETVGNHIPLLWVRMQDAIIRHKENKEALFCVKFEQLRMVFENLFSLNWSKDAFKYFHEQGLVIYLDRNQDLDLSDWILLKPEILVDIIILLVTPSPQMTQERGLRRDWNLLQKKGLLTKPLLKNIISKVKESVEAMTAFLEEYDLICPLANSKVNICRVHEGEEQPTHFVPSLLPMASERDTPIWHDDDTDKKCYVFFTKFLPEPLFHHLLSRAHKLSKVEFPNGHTVLFRDAGRFWLTPRQPYSLKLMKEEKMIEVTFRCR